MLASALPFLASGVSGDNQTVRHESDLSTNDSFGCKTAGLDQGDFQMSSDWNNSCVMFQCNQCLLCQCQFQLMSFFLELCNLPRPRTTQLAVALAPSIQSHSFFTVQLCQTHGLNQRPRVEPIGQNSLLRVLTCNHSLGVQQMLQQSLH